MVHLTDCEKYKNLFNETKVKYSVIEDTNKYYMVINSQVDGWPSKDKYVNDGYTDFYNFLVFDIYGKLLEF